MSSNGRGALTVRTSIRCSIRRARWLTDRLPDRVPEAAARMVRDAGSVGR
jgi:hypothetical protein